MAGERLWLLLPRPVRELPADLAAVIALVVLTDLSVLVPIVRETPLRIVFGLVFVLFLPGYAFIAALFPEAGTGPVAEDRVAPSGAAGGAAEGATEETAEEATEGAAEGATEGATEGAAEGATEGPAEGATEGPAEGATEGATHPDAGGSATGFRDRGIDGIERVALSFGLSIAIVPLIGLVLNFTPWGIRLVPIVLSVSGFTLAAAVLAAIRRWELPAEERFRVPYEGWIAGMRAELFAPETRTDAALNLLLVASIVLAVGSVGYAVAVPKQGESFTEFYLLTEKESGELVAADYPTEFQQGERKSVIVGIGNQEHEPMSYTVVVELQRVEFPNESNTTTVLDADELDRFSARVSHNETWTRPYQIAPTMTGERLRLAFLLYRNEAPANSTVEGAYRELHLWVNVSGGQSA